MANENRISQFTAGAYSRDILGRNVMHLGFTM